MTPAPSTADIQQFFEQLYPACDAGYLVLSQPDTTKRNPTTGKAPLLSTWLNLAQTALPRAAEIAATLSTTGTVYHGVALQRPDSRPDRYHRSTNAGAYILPGLWADIDLAYGDHKASALPTTDRAALDFL